MKILSANQLVHISGGTQDVVMLDAAPVPASDAPAEDTSRPWTSYLPSLRDTLLVLGGAVVGGLALWGIGHTFFKDATPSSN